MKNIHLLPTDEPSRLAGFQQITNDQGIDKSVFKLKLMKTYISSEDLKVIGCISHNLYITSNEEIKDVRPHKGKWQLEKGYILNKFPTYLTDLSECKLVIMTTDQELISDGVQAIDDEFLLWFVKNPSCEKIKTIVEYKDGYDNWFEYNKEFWDKHEPGNKPKFGTRYKIIIPKEGPKTFKELFANTGIEPITDESGNIHYNFKATMKEEPKQEIHVIEALKDISNHLDKMNARAEQHAALEEAAKKYSKIFSLDGGHRSYAGQGFIDGAKWQREQSLSDIRNKLTPFKNLIAMMKVGVKYRTPQFQQLIEKEIEECKESIKYLSNDTNSYETKN